MTRVLWLATSFPRHGDDPSGAFLLPLARWLGREVDLVVATPRSAAHAGEPIPGVHRVEIPYAPRRFENLFFGDGAPDALRRQPWRWPLAATTSASLVRTITVHRPDVVLAHWLLPCGLASSTARRLGGPPWVGYAHGTDVAWLERVPRLARVLSASASSLAAPSPSLAARLAKVADRTVELLPLPVEMGATGALLDRRDVGFLGRPTRRKGLHVLLVAAARARLSVLVGGDGAERGSMAQLADQLGVDVRWLGTVAPQDRGRFFASIRVLAVPSVGPEGSPAVISEAQAHGVPVVGARVAGIADVLGDASCAPPGDAKALSLMMGRALHDEKWRVRALEAGRVQAALRRPDVLGPRHLALLLRAAG